jgi:hypothetical protein
MLDFESNNDAAKSLLGEDAPPAAPTYLDTLQMTPESASDTMMSKDDFIPFYGKAKPSHVLAVEKMHHRLIITLKAKGMTNVAIAAELSVTPATVSNVLRQDWARERLAKLIHDSGKDVIRGVLEGACLDSVYKLIDLRDAKETPPAVVKASCDSLIDRYLGKPTQHVEVEQSTTVNHSDIKSIDRELDALTKEQNRILNNATS